MLWFVYGVVACLTLGSMIATEATDDAPVTGVVLAALWPVFWLLVLGYGLTAWGRK